MIIGTITLLSILLFGGGSFSFEKAYKEFVKEVVLEKDRQEQIIDVTKTADAALDQYTKEIKKVWAADVKKTFRDYDTTRDDYRAMIDRAERSREALQQQILDTRMEVVKLMTEEEWKAMYKAIHEKEAEEQAKREKKQKDD
jgi:hypothetical protein